MATVRVQPGVCGFEAEIHAVANDDMTVQITIKSDCPQISRLGEAVAEVSAMELLRRPIHETPIYHAAGAAGCHAACPVPAAVLKAIEVSAGLALPRDVHMSIQRD